MNWQTIKSSGDLALDGIAFDCEFRDGTLSACTMTDKAGHAVRFVLESYTVKAMVPAKPKTKTVHVVVGKIRGFGSEMRESFDEKYEANSRKSEIEQADVCESVEVRAEEVEVPF